MSAAEPASTTESEPARTYESSLPEWQQWFNRFAENWIFAFIVAMAVRHFGIEFFRIPTASMEPMLYGDPGFSQSDHVAVDKLFFRFRGVHRWDVAVFQFPQPEIEVNGQAVPAVTYDEHRLDKPLIRPLMYRNFVKRAVILPGDKFYIANGDIFLQQAEGGWQVSRKPQVVQEAVWADIYRHGAQQDYKPWKPVQPALIDIKKANGHLIMELQDKGAVVFDQPLRNLYLKDGSALVRPAIGNKPEEIVTVGLTKPEFTYNKSQRGNIWDYDHWIVTRLTSEDLDNVKNRQGTNSGRDLNKSMNEFIGDVRVIAEVSELKGHIVLRISEGKDGKINDLQLHLYPMGWQLERAGQVLAKGDQSVVGKTFSLANLDDQVIFTLEKDELFRGEIAKADPQIDRTAIEWRGAGGLDLAGVTIQRDVHYSANMGFAHPEVTYNADQAAFKLALAQGTYELQVLNQSAKELNDKRNVRAQMLGKKPEELTPEQCWQRIGFSPETSITAPKGAYLMLGDNSPLSWDGRCWGWVPEENFRGRALAVVLPPKRWKIIH